MSAWDAFPKAADPWAAFPADAPESLATRPSLPEATVTPERGAGVKALRLGEMASRGFMDSAAETVGALPDLVATGMRKVGLPAPEPGFYTKKVKAGADSLGRVLSTPLNAAADALGVDLGSGGRQQQGVSRLVTGGPAVSPDNFESGWEKAAYGGGRGAADAASIALPAAALSRVLPAGGVARGVTQALSSAPVTQLAAGATGGAVGEATGSPLAGAAAALAVPLAGAALGRVVTPVRSQLNPEQARLAGVAAENGIELTPAMRTGSRPLQTMESVFGTLPLTAGPQRAVTNRIQEQFNRAALERAGIEADRATPDVLNAGRAVLGRQFDSLSARNALDANAPGFVDRLATIADDAARFSVPEVAAPVRNRIDQILARVGEDGRLPGQAYREIDSAIGRTMRGTTNGDLRSALGDVRDTLRQAMDSSISPQDQAAWQQARREYANLMTIARAMNANTAATAAGNIPPAQLAQAVRGQGNNAAAMGRGDLNDLSRVGQSFVKDPIPNSGTAERTMMGSLLTGGPIGAGGAGIAMGADPMLTAAGAGAALALPRVVQALYGTAPVGRYLTNQMVRPEPDAMRNAVAAALIGREKDRSLAQR